MTKIWGEVFWKPAPRPNHAANRQMAVKPSAWMTAPTAVLALSTIFIGLGAEVVFKFAVKAAEELSHPQYYVAAVLGKS